MLTGCRSWGWGVLNFKVLELIRGKYYEDYHRLWDIILQIKIGLLKHFYRHYLVLLQYYNNNYMKPFVNKVFTIFL